MLSHAPYNERAQAFRRLAREMGFAGSLSGEVRHDVSDYVRRYANAPEERRPTGLIASNDGIAIRLLVGLGAAGISVPRQVSVVGIDGRPWGADAAPPLTSWEYDWSEWGRRAVRFLIGLARGESPPTPDPVGGQLLPRGSTGPPPRTAGV